MEFTVDTSILSQASCLIWGAGEKQGHVKWQLSCRLQVSATRDDEGFIIFGGCPSSPCNPNLVTEDVWKFDLTKSEWNLLQAHGDFYFRILKHFERMHIEAA